MEINLVIEREKRVGVYITYVINGSTFCCQFFTTIKGSVFYSNLDVVIEIGTGNLYPVGSLDHWIIFWWFNMEWKDPLQSNRKGY